VTTNGPVRLGLLGCADIAQRRVLDAVKACDGVELAAVASRDAEKAKLVASRFDARPVHGYQELLDLDEVDAVYVPLPSGLHARWIGRALCAGKHVLAEKPLTTDLARTAELVARAGDSGLVLMENFMFVHHSQHDRVRTLIADGEIGEIRAVNATFTMPPRPAGDIRYQRELGGGALLDNGAYPVRTAQLFLGEELTVVGATLRHDPEHGVDVGGSALLARADGVTAHLTFGMEHHYVSGYQILGSKGRITLDRAFTPPAAHRPMVRVDHQDVSRYELLPADDQCVNTVAAFVTAVRSGAGATTGSTMLTQARLVDAIREKANTP
jgi:predicted dehydrogenase